MEHSPKSRSEGKSLVTVLACVLTRLIEANSASGHDQLGPSNITKFHALVPPAICVADYLDRILKYSSCSNECFVLALIYIDRLIQFNNFALTSLNVHRVIITSILVAAKFFDDQYYNNAYYAKVGGVPCGELNSLETEFLFGVNFGLHVNAEEFYKYRTQLANHSVILPAQIAPRRTYDEAHSCNAQHLSESKRAAAALFCSPGGEHEGAQHFSSALPLYG